MKKKSGFSLIEIILGLAIVAAMSVVAFVTYSYISEKMIVKKESDFSYDVVTTTRTLFNNTALKPDSLQYGLNDVIMSELKNSNPYYAKKFADMSNIQTPFLEYVTIALASPEGGYGDRRPGQFVYVPQYPQKGMYSVSRCLKLANNYMGRYGNIQVFSGASFSSVEASDPDRQSKIQEVCSQYSGDGSFSAGIGFTF